MEWGILKFIKKTNTIGDCTCTDYYTGPDCEIAPDLCLDLPVVVDCGDHGVCDGTTGVCVCLGNWTGVLCDSDVDPCAGVYCSVGSSCSGGVCG